MNYGFAGARKTLALGVYPAATLARARQRRDRARALLADGVDPSTAKRQEKQAKIAEAANAWPMRRKTSMDGPTTAPRTCPRGG
jgi:hypothetical protein